MNIADVLELALGRPPSMPVGNPVYHEWMQMLERAWYQWERITAEHPYPECWFKKHPQAVEPYRAWVQAGKPSREWTVQEHIQAAHDNNTAALRLLRG